MTTISAKTILRSRNAARPDKVLSTLLLRYPRWIHAEQRTHRVISLGEGLEIHEPTPSLMADPNLSRNAASSRAIPVKKLIQDVISDPAIPIFWGKNQPGMQAAEETDDLVALPVPAVLRGNPLVDREAAWLAARDMAVKFAKAYEESGYHKQIVNRLLEPFSHITVLVSATEWDNFLELRDHPDAEPHIQMLAREIRKCLEDESTIQTLQPGEWHLPFIDIVEVAGLVSLEDRIKLSAARCASTSYKTVDGFDMTLERAQAIFDKLVTSKPIHASPLEHVAQADDWVSYDKADRPWANSEFGWANSAQHGNFEGFRQYRHMLT